MVQKWAKNNCFSGITGKNCQNQKYFGFFLVSYLCIQKKKGTSEQFRQGRPTVHVMYLVLL